MFTSASGRHFRARWLLALGVVLVLGVVQTPWCVSMIARLALRTSDVDLQFDSLHGFWMHSLEVRGLEGNVGEYMIRVDTAHVHLSAGHLFVGRLHAQRVDIINPEVKVRSIVSEEPPEMSEEDAEPLSFLWIDSIRIEGGNFHLEDQMIGVSGIHLLGSLSPDIVQLDTLYGDVMWQKETLQLSAVAGILIDQGLFQIDTLSLNGPESSINASGYVGRQTDLDVIAAPLSADILNSLLPNIEESLTIFGELQGSDDSLHLALSVESTGGSILKLHGSTRTDVPFVQLDTLDFQNLNLAYLSPDLTGGLTGSIYGYVEGVSWDSLDGSVNADMKAGILADIPIESASLTGNMERGEMQVKFDSKLASGSLNLEGIVRPFSASGQLSGRFNNLNTQVLAPQHESALNGSLMVEWRDSLGGYVELLPGRLGKMEINGGELKLYSQSETFQLEATIHSDSAQIALRAERQESGLTGRLEVYALDVGALMNQEKVNSQVSLTAEAATNWPPDSITAQIEVQPSSWEKIPIRQGYVELLLHGLNLDVRGHVGLASGNTTMQGSMNFGSSLPAWTLNQAQIEGLDLRDFGMDVRTDLNAQLQASGMGLETVTGQLVMDSSIVNRESVPGGDILIGMSEGEAIVESHLALGSGTFESKVTAYPFAALPTVEIVGGLFEAIDLGALLDIDSLSTSLTGRIDSLRWANNGHVTLTLDSGVVNSSEISGAQLQVHTFGDTLSAAGRIELDKGYLKLDQVRVGPGQEIVAQGSLKNMYLGDFGFTNAVLNGSFDVDIEGMDPHTMTVHRARIEADSTTIGGVQFDRIRVAGNMDEGNVRLDQFDVFSNAGYLRGEGEVSLFGGSTDSLRFTGAITNAGLLADWTGDVPISGAATDTLWGQLTHQRDSLRWVAGIHIEPMSWKSTHLFRASGYAEGTLQDFKPRVGKGEITLERLSIPNLSARHALLAVAGNQDRLRYEGILKVDDQRSLYLKGDVDFAARQGILSNLDLYLDQDEWRLGVPAEIIANDGIRVRYFVLESDDQEITLDGILNPEGEQRLGLNLYNVQISPFTDILGLPDLGGIANADIFFHGPATAPQLTGSLDLAVDSEDKRVGSVSARIDYRDSGLDMEAEFSHVDGSNLTMSGLLPLDLRLKKEEDVSFPEASLTLQANRFNLAWISPFLMQDEISDVQGKLTADIGITGSRTTPNLTGNLRLSDGYARLPQLRIAPEDFELDAVLSQDTVYFEKLATSSGRGTAEGFGYVTLAELNQGDIDLALNLSDFRVVNTAPYAADVSGSVAVQGTLRRPDLTGHIEVANAVIRPQDVPVTLADGSIHFTEEDLQMLEQYFNIRASVWDTTTYSLVDALSMNLSVGIPGTVRLHGLQNPEMTVLLSGSLALSKEPYAEQELRGTVSIVPELSYLRQFGRRFDIRRGRVTFSGPATDPFFDLQAALDIPNRSGQDTPITILLDASGQLQDPESLAFELRSEPVQLDRADMISYMATGRPAANAFQLGGGGAFRSGSGLALQQLSSLVAGAAGAGLGLDVVQIDPETRGGVTLTAGKYVSRKLFASVKWPITEEQTTSNNTIENNRELVIEYSLYPWLVARMRGESGAVGLSLLYQYTW